MVLSISNRSLRVVLLSLLIGYGYVFLEWLFFVTKPSFLQEMGWWNRLMVLFGTGGILGIFIGVITLGMVFIGRGLSYIKQWSIWEWIGYFVPGIVFAVSALILVDNFTYTIFGKGVVTAQGLWRLVYAIGVLFGVWFGTSQLRKWSIDINGHVLVWSVVLLVGISTVAWGSGYIYSRNMKMESPGTAGVFVKRPHILLITVDGLSASHLSLYGYKRDTTPFLASKVGEFLVAENAFPNAPKTILSVTAMLTGRNVVELGMKSQVSILKGQDTFKHLPAFLQQYGYQGIQLGEPVYIDAYMVNMQGGFEQVNGRTLDNWEWLKTLRELGQDDEAYFLARLIERAGERLSHIFIVTQQMTNPFEKITVRNFEATRDDAHKIESAIRLLEQAQRPMFIHVHLLSTHANKFFYVPEQHFSAGQTQSRSRMTDFYDDAILYLDRQVEVLYHHLSEMGLLDQTIFVIASDHGMQYQIARVPLLFRFPHGSFSGRITNNVQNLDIAPTLVDYLGLEIPDWMEGKSLLQGEPEAERILVVGSDMVVACEHVYLFQGKWWLVMRVSGHTRPCSQEVRQAADVPEHVRKYFAEIHDAEKVEGGRVFYIQDEMRILSRRVMVKALLLESGKKIEELPEAEGIFEDVLVTDRDASMIEYAYRQGWLEACEVSPMRFCPDQPVRREEVALALLRSTLGYEYRPPAPRGLFVDVPVDSPYASWIEDLYRRKITSGCSRIGPRYCPQDYILITPSFITLLSRLKP